MRIELSPEKTAEWVEDHDPVGSLGDDAIERRANGVVLRAIRQELQARDGFESVSIENAKAILNQFTTEQFRDAREAATEREEGSDHLSRLSRELIERCEAQDDG